MSSVPSSALGHRGDTPALAIIDRNARSLAQRVADETRQELREVLERIDYIYAHFEVTQSLQANEKPENMEYLNDMAELEEIIKDQVKKKKYQHQVTIFIVGYENVCGQKLRLLQQVNEFFMDNANKFDEDDTTLRSPELDLEDMSETVEESLSLAEDLTKRLTEIHRETIDYMYNYAQAKASNKSKKKLEKALEKAKDEVGTLSEQLLLLQEEIEEKEEKMQQMFKQIEMKNMECQRYKTAAEVAKKSSTEADALREECSRKTQTINEFQLQLDSLKVGEAGRIQERSRAQLQTAKDISAEKELELELALEQSNLEHDAVRSASDEEWTPKKKKELQQLHDDQVDDLTATHRQQIGEMTRLHRAEIETLTTDLEDCKERLILFQPRASYCEDEDLEDDDGRDQEKHGLAGGKGSTFMSLSKESSRVKTVKRSKPRSRLENSTRGSHRMIKKIQPVSRNSQLLVKDTTLSDVECTTSLEFDVTLSRQTSCVKSHSTLAPVSESEAGRAQLDDAFSLSNDDAWDGVPEKQLLARFQQYRKLAQENINQLSGQLETTVAKTVVKVNTLKAQFYEHRHKWQAERDVLVQQVEQAFGMQMDAEQEADSAMEQLESFINKQEELEESEAKLTDFDRTLLSQTDDAKAGHSADVDVDTAVIGEEQTSSLSDGPAQSRATLSDGPAHSRATLRRQHRDELNTLRTSATERRHRSPAVEALRTHMSVLTNAELDENADMPFPPDELNYADSIPVSMHEMGTSPMTVDREKTSSTLQSRISLSVRDHPIVQLYLETYKSIVDFKESLSQLFMNKDLMSSGQWFGAVEVIPLDRDQKVQPQLEAMAEHTARVLMECLHQVMNILQHPTTTDYPVSPLTNTLPNLSPAATALPPENTMVTTAGSSPRREGRQGSAQRGAVERHLQQLQADHDLLKQTIEEERENTDKQQSHNTILMMEMQDTINNLQRELASVMEEAAILARKESVEQSPVMFTRLDSERNAKMLKRAVNEHRLSQRIYEDALDKMADYVSLPMRRLASLVRKYVHHCHMKLVEHNIRRRKTYLDEDVYATLNKMELLQNERAKKWADSMDEMGARRQILANSLLETLVNIETQSGIFLIKPMYSLKAGYAPHWLRQKVSRSSQRGARQACRPTSHGLQPTPLSRTQGAAAVDGASGGVDTNPEDGITGLAQHLIGQLPQPSWKPFLSESKPLPLEGAESYFNTPRMLELDVNRMLIGQNQISAKMAAGVTPTDRLAAPLSANLRSYVTVSRQAGQTGSSVTRGTATHPATALDEGEGSRHVTRRIGSVTGRTASCDMGRTLGSSLSGKRAQGVEGESSLSGLSTPSLPAISPTQSGLSTPSLPAISPTQRAQGDYPLPPPSPPGSSLRYSVTPRKGVNSVTPKNGVNSVAPRKGSNSH